MSEQHWTVYLSGEIHTDWREKISAGVEAAGLPISFVSPVTDHASSDDCGANILGSEPSSFWHDHKGAGLNSIRRRKLIQEANIVVVRFGKKYKHNLYQKYEKHCLDSNIHNLRRILTLLINGETMKRW